MLLDVNWHGRFNCVAIYLPIWCNHKGSIIVEPQFLQWIRNKDQVAVTVDSREFPCCRESIVVIKALQWQIRKRDFDLTIISSAFSAK